MGGEILNLDPVRDQFFLRAFGERPMKIPFDQQTPLYRDGKRIKIPPRPQTLSRSKSRVLDRQSLLPEPR
jgi:hypothetical protein